MLSNQHLIKIFNSSPLPGLVLRADSPCFTIEGVNLAYLHVTGTKEEYLIGKGIFEAFPDNIENPDSTGVTNLRQSLLQVINTGIIHSMPLLKDMIYQ
ncbi:MAG TPA: hypothetical protein VNI52_07510 [Sphingobacteriaceae bacterium]|nr:hypothetical protein [Sphingobacteriaceae bacterium]